MRVSEVDKAFGATFIDLEDSMFIRSVAYRKGGSIHMYLKGDKLDTEEVPNEVQNEVDEVLESILRLSSGDVKFKDRHTKEYRFTVLDEKNVKKAFNRVHRAFKRKSAD